MAAPTCFTVIDGVTDTTIRAHASVTNTSGQALTSIQYSYATYASSTQSTIPPSGTPIYNANLSDGSFVISGLTPGTVYSIWTSASTSGISGAWSSRRNATTWFFGARYLMGTAWKNSVVYVKNSGAWKMCRPWVKIAGVWKPTG